MFGISAACPPRCSPIEPMQARGLFKHLVLKEGMCRDGRVVALQGGVALWQPVHGHLHGAHYEAHHLSRNSALQYAPCPSAICVICVGSCLSDMDGCVPLNACVQSQKDSVHLDDSSSSGNPCPCDDHMILMQPDILECSHAANMHLSGCNIFVLCHALRCSGVRQGCGGASLTSWCLGNRYGLNPAQLFAAGFGSLSILPCGVVVMGASIV